jgi:hypothetical protein
MVLQMVAMGLELYQLHLEADILTQQSPWSLNLLWSKPQCLAPPQNHLTVMQPVAAMVVDTMPHQTEHSDSI